MCQRFIFIPWPKCQDYMQLEGFDKHSVAYEESYLIDEEWLTKADAKLSGKSKQFYMNYVEGGCTPRVIHPTFDSAHREARRLAEHTHKPAYILTAIRKVAALTTFEEEEL